MSYSLATLWYERQRYLPGVLAVAFSCLLIALQCGLLLGLFSITSLPIDTTKADIWVGHPEVLSVDLDRSIPAAWQAYVAAMPEVERSELYIQGFAYWDKPTGGVELVHGHRFAAGPGRAWRDALPDARDAVAIDRAGVDHHRPIGVRPPWHRPGRRLRGDQRQARPRGQHHHGRQRPGGSLCVLQSSKRPVRFCG